MNISKLSKFAWAFFALALGTATVFAQGYRNRNNVPNNQDQACLNVISDLTDQQKSKIGELVKSHRVKMNELRIERRSTADVIEKNEIRGTMLKTVKAHRDEVRSLLTDGQKKEYDNLNNARIGNGTRPGNGNFQGCQRFRGPQMAYGNFRHFNNGNRPCRFGNGGYRQVRNGCFQYQSN